MTLSQNHETWTDRLSSIASSGFLTDPEGVIAILGRRRRLILGSMLTCLVFAALSILVSGKLYQASARLLVMEPGGVPLEAAGGAGNRLVQGVEDEIPTHISLICSQVIVRRAIESVGLNNIRSLSGLNLDAATRAVTKELSAIRPDRQAKIIQVSYAASSPEEAVLVLQAVTDSYKSFLEEVYASKNSEVVYLMSRARDNLAVELKDLEKKYLEFRRNTPSLTGDGAGRSFLNHRVDEWDKTARDLMVKAVRLQSQLELGKELAKEGAGLWATTFALDQLGGGLEGQGLKTLATGVAVPNEHVRMLLVEQQKMADQLGPQSTKVKEIQEQIASSLAETRRSKGKVDQPEVQDLLTSIEKSLKSIVSMRSEIQTKFEADMELAKSAEIDLLTDTNLKNELDRQRKLYDTVLEQLKRSKIAGDYSGVGTQVVETPNALPSPVRPRVTLTLLLGLIAGLMTGVGAGLVAESLDPVIRTTGSACRATSLPSLGQVPFDERSLVEAGPLGGPVCQTRPRSPAADAFRLIRARIDLACRGKDVKVIMITGPAGGEGKSTVASNLAAAMAQSGRRILLIDADLRTPSLHLMFGVSKERGFSHLLRGLMPPDRLIRPTSIRNLDLIPSGPEPSDPTALLETGELAELLEPLRSSYDMILIDAPSMRGSADATLMGSMVDAVLLVVGIPVSCRPKTRQAVIDLGIIGTPVLGLVVNNVSLAVPPWSSRQDKPEGAIRSDSREIPRDPRFVIDPRDIVPPGQSLGVRAFSETPGNPFR